MKKINPIARCVIVLCSVSLLCGGLIIGANKVFGVSNEERLGRTLNKLLPNSGAVVVFDIDDKTKNSEILAFNEAVPQKERIDGQILRVYRVKDKSGVNEGKCVIEAEGAGFGSSSVSLIAFNKNGTVYGVAVKSFGLMEDRTANFSVSSLSNLIKTKSQELESAGKLGEKITSSIMPSTGATRTIDGILNATNLATLFFKQVIIGDVDEVLPVELVENLDMIGKLDGLFALDGQAPFSSYYKLAFVNKPSEKIANIGSGNANNKAGIVAAYVSDDLQLVLHVAGEGFSDDNGGNGVFDVLMLMNDEGTIAAVYLLSTTATYEYVNGIDYSQLIEQLKNTNLTNQLRGKEAAYFAAADNDIFISGATESNNGIKVVAYLALTECENMRTLALATIAEHGLMGVA